MFLFISLYSFFICFIVDYFSIHEHFDGAVSFHSLLGVVLGLFLVFRTNTAYDRWWEGRRLWGQLTNDSRALAMKINAFIPNQYTSDRTFFINFISNFSIALKQHLRSEPIIEGLLFQNEEEKKQIDSSINKPAEICACMAKRISTIYKEKKIDGFQLQVLTRDLNSFTDVLGGCERIKSTPIPRSYRLFLRKFLFLYTYTLPFAFVLDFKYITVPIVMLVFYILVSVELIAAEIEDPFGRDVNDLPTDIISTNINKSITQIIKNS